MPYPKSEQHPDPEGAVIFIGAFLLALLAGFVNGSMLQVLDVPVSHMSGAISRFATDLAVHRPDDLKFISIIVGFFALGSAVSGVIIGGQHLDTDKPYGVVLILEAIALFVAYWLLREENGWSLACAAMACGLQNAMVSRYYGMVIRTTHVTGVVTDIGFMLGAWMRHRTIKAWRLGLLTLILVGFAIGIYVSALMLQTWRTVGLLVAAISCMSIGCLYFTWNHFAALRNRDGG